MTDSYWLRGVGIKQQIEVSSNTNAKAVLEQMYPGHKIVESVVAAWNVSHNFYLDEWGTKLLAETAYDPNVNWFNSF